MHSRHGQTRCQQRAIPAEAIDALLAFGEQRRRGGADVYFLDKRGRLRLAEAIGPERYRRLEKSFDSYVVVADDDTLITAAHRYRRMRF